MKVIILAPYDFSTMKGNTLRPALQCLGLLKNGFSSFELRSRTPFASIGSLCSPIRRGFWSWLPKKIRPLGGSGYLFDMPFWRKIKVDEPNTIVHAHNFYTFFLIPSNCIKIADLHTFKYNEMYHNYSNSNKNEWWMKIFIYKTIFAPIVKILEHRICQKADKVIVASTNIADIMSETFGLSKDKFITINNTLLITDFEINQHIEPFQIGVVGSFTDQLNQEVIPEVLKIARLTSLPILLIGSINERDKALFKNFPSVKILGRVSDEEYKKWMCKISVLLAPYTTYRHGGGLRNKLMEAAICGTPIVTTPSGAEGFENKELLCIGESVSVLIQQIYKLQNPKLRLKWGKDLRAYAMQNFDCEKEGKKLKHLYESLNIKG